VREKSMGPSAAALGMVPERAPASSQVTHAPVGAADEGFADLYRANHRALSQLAFLLTQSAEVADDLVQDVFARVLPIWRRLEEPVPYLRRSVVNAANSWHRRRRVERSRPAPAEGSTGLAADELFDVLARLPPRQRSAVVLRYYEDLSDAEVAAALGCRPGTVPSLVHRAFERLRIAMADHPAAQGLSPDEGAGHDHTT
jgi:RNA polymerase sigma-70 factor (sigma-E family)